MEKEKNNFMSLEEFLSTTEDDTQSDRYWEEAAEYFDNMTDDELVKYSAERGYNLDIKTLREILAKGKKELLGK